MTTAVHPGVTQFTLDFVMDLLSEEREKMLAIAISLYNRLEPKNLQDIKEHEDQTAWRLAQLLEERLSTTEFENAVRELLHVKPIGGAV
jgi:hypothetical protein